MSVADKSFIGSIPEPYDRLDGAADLRMLCARSGGESSGICAPICLRSGGGHRRCMACAPYAVFRQADPQALPFDGAPFGVALCQFGTMFFPDRANAYREAKRILKSGGTYLLNVWNRIEDNEFVDEVAMAYCQDTPLRAEIEARGDSHEEATPNAAQAISRRFGHDAVSGRIKALVVAAR